MSYTNSPLVVYTKLSPNHSGQRTQGISRISPHCVVLSQFSDKTTYPRKFLIREEFQKLLISWTFLRIVSG